METTLAILAAVVASVFAFDIGRSALARPRLHAQIWTVAMGFFALATWALAVGLLFGWSGSTFRIFYFFGAIANIPLLAAGSVALVVGEVWGRRTIVLVGVFVALGVVATLSAPLEGPVPEVGVPEGSDLFAFGIDAGGLTLPGPRVFAIAAGSIGTLLIIGFAAASAVRAWRGNRRLTLGNALIVLGAISPAIGGSLTALGEGGGLALSLLLGAALLYAGYRLAAGSRTATEVAA